MPPQFSPSSDAAPYPPAFICHHPGKKNIVKPCPFSSAPSIYSSHPRKIITVKHSESSYSSFAAQYPRALFGIFNKKAPYSPYSVTINVDESDHSDDDVPKLGRSDTKAPYPPVILLYESDSDDDVPKLGRSNTMTGTKKLAASLRWNGGLILWKKDEEKEGESSHANIDTTLPENELPVELPEAKPSISVSDLSIFVVAFVHIILSLGLSRNETFWKLFLLQSLAILHLRVLNLHLPGLGDMIHCQRARNPKLPVPATILPVVFLRPSRVCR